MTGDDEGQSALDDAFASSRDRGADDAAPAPEAIPPPKPEPEAKDASKPDAEAKGDDGEQKQYRDPETGRFVPLTELKTERQKRQEETRLRTEAEQRAIAAEARAEEARRYAENLYRQQNQQHQPQQQQVDPWADPEGYRQTIEQQARNAALNERLNISQMMAEEKHGAEVVQKALNEAARRGVAQHFLETRNPYAELVTWYQRVESLQKIGDPQSFEQRVREEERKKVLAELKAGPAQQQKFPGTLADAPAAGAQGSMLSDQAMLDQAFASDRRRRSG